MLFYIMLRNISIFKLFFNFQYLQNTIIYTSSKNDQIYCMNFNLFTNNQPGYKMLS